MKKLNVLAAAALAATSFGAHANVTKWAAHDPVEIGFGFVAPGAFLDFYTFVLNPGVSVVASVTVSNDNALPGLPSTHVSNGSYGLFLDPNASVSGGTGLDGDEVQYPLFGAFCTGSGTCAFNGQTGSTINATITLGGSYFYAVGGVADGTGGGVYTITSAAVTLPVPEPETYALLLAGLGAVGFAARRKQAR